MPQPLRVAACVSTYHHNTHADVILRHILNGYPPDFKTRPDLRLVSVYTNQVSEDPKRPDISRDLAKEHGFQICDTIRDALTLGGKTLAVDGVLSIFEHGDYPDNKVGQKLYPRRWAFEQITDVFEDVGKVVPVFSDKHLGPRWDDAKWMVDRARKMMVPFMCGSSLPVTYRKPDLVLPIGCELTAAVSFGYGHFEHYGIHAIEGMQCMVERRKGAETGVKAVTAHTGRQIWSMLDENPVVKPVFEAALERILVHAKGDIRTASRPDSSLIEIEYRDGFRGYIPMVNGWIYEGDDGAFSFATQIKGEEKPRATVFYLQSRGDQYPHFANLVRAFDSMVHTGHAPYPCERTLLTSGIMDAAMHSRARRGERVETPHLAIGYKPVTWPHGGEPPQWAIEAGAKKK